jgi:hypothetical protein
MANNSSINLSTPRNISCEQFEMGLVFFSGATITTEVKIATRFPRDSKVGIFVSSSFAFVSTMAGAGGETAANQYSSLQNIREGPPSKG